tara:strand:+ start:1062 stop:2444 length:1383 start_codon:yes stop_codon:yes gene_type:complete
MAIQIYDMGVDFTKGERTHESFSDFRKKQADTKNANASARSADAQTDRYRLETQMAENKISQDAKDREAFQNIYKGSTTETGIDQKSAGTAMAAYYDSTGRPEKANLLRKGIQEEITRMNNIEVADQKETDSYLLPIAYESTVKQIELSSRMLRNLGKPDKADFLDNYLKDNKERLMSLPLEVRQKEIHDSVLSLMSPEQKKSVIKDIGSRFVETNPAAPTLPPMIKEKTFSEIETARKNQADEKLAKIRETRELAKVANDQRIEFNKNKQSVAAMRLNIKQVTRSIEKLVGKLDTREKVNYQGRLIDNPNFGELLVDREGNVIKEGHPGFEDYVGMTYAPKFATLFDGSDAADFASQHKKLIGMTFKNAFEQLKGGGSITEIEGDKANAALNALVDGKNMSETEYKKAAATVLVELRELMDLSRKKKDNEANSDNIPVSEKDNELSIEELRAKHLPRKG